MRTKMGGLLISKINFLSGRTFSKIINNRKKLEINNSQGRILFVLSKFKEMNINSLGDELSLSKSTLTSMLDRLEKSGYIKKNLNTIDKRKTLISITKKGEGVAKAYDHIIEEMTEIYYKDFTEEEIYEFEMYLEKIYSNLKNANIDKE